MINKQTEVVFIRHGETNMNSLNLYFGHLDPELNEKGKEQLEKSRKLLKKMEKDIYKIFCSPLKRCVQSLEILKIPKKIKKEYLDEFKEMNFGVFEGKTYKQIKNEYPELVEKMTLDWKYFKVPEGESLFELQKRTIKKLEELINENKGKKILIVAHAGVIKVILSYYLYENLDGYWKIKIDNGSMSKIVRLDDGFTFVDYINRIW